MAGGGFYPARTLPCVIDVGTNNPQLLGSEEYLGVQRKRIEGKGYYDLVDEFMDAVKLRWPKAVIQFEDFEVQNGPFLPPSTTIIMIIMTMMSWAAWMNVLPQALACRGLDHPQRWRVNSVSKKHH